MEESEHGRKEVSLFEYLKSNLVYSWILENIDENPAGELSMSERTHLDQVNQTQHKRLVRHQHQIEVICIS